MGELLHTLHARLALPPRFAATHCSQCGTDLGPGNSGVSSCSDHGPAADVAVSYYTALADEATRLTQRPANPEAWPSWLNRLPERLLKRAADALAADLALMQGHGHQPQPGCFHAEAFLGDADVLVEFEHEGESGDGYHEPHYDESIKPLCVLVNGKWVDADQFADDVQDRWTEAGWEHLKHLREAAEEDRAAAMHADRLERCE